MVALAEFLSIMTLSSHPCREFYIDVLISSINSITSVKNRVEIATRRDQSFCCINSVERPTKKICIDLKDNNTANVLLDYILGHPSTAKMVLSGSKGRKSMLKSDINNEQDGDNMDIDLEDETVHMPLKSPEGQKHTLIAISRQIAPNLAQKPTIEPILRRRSQFSQGSIQIDRDTIGHPGLAAAPLYGIHQSGDSQILASSITQWQPGKGITEDDGEFQPPYDGLNRFPQGHGRYPSQMTNDASIQHGDSNNLYGTTPRNDHPRKQHSSLPKAPTTSQDASTIIVAPQETILRTLNTKKKPRVDNKPESRQTRTTRNTPDETLTKKNQQAMLTEAGRLDRTKAAGKQSQTLAIKASLGLENDSIYAFPGSENRMEKPQKMGHTSIIQSMFGSKTPKALVYGKNASSKHLLNYIPVASQQNEILGNIGETIHAEDTEANSGPGSSVHSTRSWATRTSPLKRLVRKQTPSKVAQKGPRKLKLLSSLNESPKARSICAVAKKANKICDAKQETPSDEIDELSDKIRQSSLTRNDASSFLTDHVSPTSNNNGVLQCDDNFINENGSIFGHSAPRSSPSFLEHENRSETPFREFVKASTLQVHEDEVTNQQTLENANGHFFEDQIEAMQNDNEILLTKEKQGSVTASTTYNSPAHKERRSQQGFNRAGNPDDSPNVATLQPDYDLLKDIHQQVNIPHPSSKQIIGIMSKTSKSMKISGANKPKKDTSSVAIEGIAALGLNIDQNSEGPEKVRGYFSGIPQKRSLKNKHSFSGSDIQQGSSQMMPLPSKRPKFGIRNSVNTVQEQKGQTEEYLTPLAFQETRSEHESSPANLDLLYIPKQSRGRENRLARPWRLKQQNGSLGRRSVVVPSIKSPDWKKKDHRSISLEVGADHDFHVPNVEVTTGPRDCHKEAKKLSSCQKVKRHLLENMNKSEGDLSSPPAISKRIRIENKPARQPPSDKLSNQGEGNAQTLSNDDYILRKPKIVSFGSDGPLNQGVMLTGSRLSMPGVLKERFNILPQAFKRRSLEDPVPTSHQRKIPRLETSLNVVKTPPTVRTKEVSSPWNQENNPTFFGEDSWPSHGSQATRVDENGSPLSMAAVKDQLSKIKVSNDGASDRPCRTPTIQIDDVDPVSTSQTRRTSFFSEIKPMTTIRKARPAPPSAPSRMLSDSVVAKITPEGNFQQIANAELLRPKQDNRNPFLDIGTPRETRFANQLRKHLNMYGTAAKEEYQQDAKMPSPFAVHGDQGPKDNDQTVVESKETCSPQPPATCPSGTIESIIDPGLADSSPSEATLDDDQQWLETLRPDQSNILEALTHVSKHLLQHLADHELAINDVSSEFERAGEKIIEDLEVSHNQDAEDLISKVRETKDDILNLYQTAEQRVRQRNSTAGNDIMITIQEQQTRHSELNRLVQRAMETRF
ncbi:MAG: hypothetical protein M1834_006387 [Cirrosporium novae-zelandiae]|nr:MAG: hypothetical protein M1834_006387 [Cirrosporium novae-zelandiae]